MGWDQLKQIQDFNREDREREAATPPVACPIDGAVLEANAAGDLHCPMDNYTIKAGRRI